MDYLDLYNRFKGFRERAQGFITDLDSTAQNIANNSKSLGDAMLTGALTGGVMGAGKLIGQATKGVANAIGGLAERVSGTDVDLELGQYSKQFSDYAGVVTSALDKLRGAREKVQEYTKEKQVDAYEAISRALAANATLSTVPVQTNSLEVPEQKKDLWDRSRDAFENWVGKMYGNGFNSDNPDEEAESAVYNGIAGATIGGIAGLAGGPSGVAIGSALGFLGGMSLASFAKAAGYMLARTSVGAISAADSIWDFTAGGVYKLLGNDEKAEAMFADSKLDAYRERVNEEWKGTAYQEGGTMERIGDFAEVIGAALPTAAIATAGGFLGATSSVALTALAAGLKTAGRSTKAAYEETGELGGKEFGYGALAGAADAAIHLGTGFIRKKLSVDSIPEQERLTEHLTEGTSWKNPVEKVLSENVGVLNPGFLSAIIDPDPKSIWETNGLGAFGSVFKKAAKNIGMEFVMPYVTNVVSEATEAGLNTWLDPFFKRWTYDKDAQDASVLDVLKAALTNASAAYLLGLGGFKETDVSFYNTEYSKKQQEQDIASGAEADANGLTSGIMEEAAKVSQSRDTYKLTQSVKEEYEDLKASLETTGGKVETDEQRQKLAALQRDTAARQMLPLVENSAINILEYPESFVEKFKNLGLKDADGNPIDISVDELTEGINYDGTEEEFFESVQQALSTNNTLAMVSASDMAERTVKPNTAQIDWMRYSAGASDQQKSELSSALGGDGSYILSRQRAKQYATTPQGQEQINRVDRITRKAKSLPTNNTPAPTVVGTGMQDGAYRFGGENGIAIIKEGSTFYVYDYARGLVSKPLNAVQLNGALARGRNQKSIKEASYGQ